MNKLEYFKIINLLSKIAINLGKKLQYELILATHNPHRGKKNPLYPE